MKALLQSSEMSRTILPTTQHHIPEDLVPQQHCYENLKSHILAMFELSHSKDL